MFASHRDACILSKYSSDLVHRLDEWYAEKGLDDTVIAYRSLGKSNYHFAKRVEEFVRSNPSLTVMCFDVTGFFNNLDHRRLKARLKAILKCEELDSDWYAVFKAVTNYRYVNLDDLKKHEVLAQRIKARKPHPLTTIQRVKALRIPINKNLADKGIPQGTPVSASLSNLYMTEFDEQMESEASSRGALYQRYSDDILIACSKGSWEYLHRLVSEKLEEHGLNLEKSKTDIVHLHGINALRFQYLGYQLGLGQAQLRQKSLSRQWRTAKRAIRKAERMGLHAIAKGNAKKIYTRKLHLRFTSAGNRNFIGYANRSAEALESAAIRKQTKRLRKYVHSELARIKRKNRV